MRLEGRAEVASLPQVEAIARSMAPLQVEAMGAPDLPGSVRLVELYDVERPDELDRHGLGFANHRNVSVVTSNISGEGVGECRNVCV